MRKPKYLIRSLLVENLLSRDGESNFEINFKIQSYCSLAEENEFFERVIEGGYQLVNDQAKTAYFDAI